MARPERFELPAFWFVARRSIQLSYGRIFNTLSAKPRLVRSERNVYKLLLYFSRSVPNRLILEF